MNSVKSQMIALFVFAMTTNVLVLAMCYDASGLLLYLGLTFGLGSVMGIALALLGKMQWATPTALTLETIVLITIIGWQFALAILVIRSGLVTIHSNLLRRQLASTQS